MPASAPFLVAMRGIGILNCAALLPLPLFDYTSLFFGPSVTGSGSQLAIQNLAPHGVRRRGRRVLPPASGRGLRRRPFVFTDQGEPRTAGRHLRMAYSTAGTVPVGFVGTLHKTFAFIQDFK